MSELRWSVRTSFFQYLAGLRDARVSVSDGAALTADDPQLVLYPADPARSDDDVLAFRGDLRLGGHGGLLFVRLANPRIRLGTPAVLSVDDPLTEDCSGPRLDLVTLRLTADGEGGWSGTEVKLTAAGTGLFNNVYAAGDAFDPLTVR